MWGQWKAVSGEEKLENSELHRSCTCSCLAQALRAAGEELQAHGAGLESGTVSRCYPAPKKERITNLTRLGIWDKVILGKTDLLY